MPGPYKGISTQCTNQQVLAKPRHQPSQRDQQAKERLSQKAKIKKPCIYPVRRKSFTNCTSNIRTGHTSDSPFTGFRGQYDRYDTVPPLYVIQEGINCIPTTDYFFTSIKPEPIVVTCHRANHSKHIAQQAATQDSVSQQTHPLQPGETRVYPSVLADKQVSVLNLIESSITSQADLQDAFRSICLCSHGRKESTEDKNIE